jgi:hypothetical protein
MFSFPLSLVIPVVVVLIVMVVGRRYWLWRDDNNMNRNPDGEPRP